MKLLYHNPNMQIDKGLLLGNKSLGVRQLCAVSDEKMELFLSSLYSGFTSNCDNVDYYSQLYKAKKSVQKGDLLGENGAMSQAVKSLKYSENKYKLGEIILGSDITDIESYRREFNLDGGIITTKYRAKESDIDDESFVMPDRDCYVRKISSVKPILNLLLKVQTANTHKIDSIDGAAHLEIYGNMARILNKNGGNIDDLFTGMAYCYTIDVLTDGVYQVENGRIFIKNAGEVLLVITAACGYNDDGQIVNDTTPIRNTCRTNYQELIKSSYTELKLMVCEYYSLYRSEFDFSLYSGAKLFDMEGIFSSKKNRIAEYIEYHINYCKYLAMHGINKYAPLDDYRGLWDIENTSISDGSEIGYSALDNIYYYAMLTYAYNIGDNNIISKYIDKIWHIAMCSTNLANKKQDNMDNILLFSRDIWNKAELTKTHNGNLPDKYILAKILLTFFNMNVTNEDYEKLEKVIFSEVESIVNDATLMEGKFLVAPSFGGDSRLINDKIVYSYFVNSTYEVAIIKALLTKFVNLYETKMKNAQLYEKIEKNIDEQSNIISKDNDDDKDAKNKNNNVNDIYQKAKEMLLSLTAFATNKKHRLSDWSFLIGNDVKIVSGLSKYVGQFPLDYFYNETDKRVLCNATIYRSLKADYKLVNQNIDNQIFALGVYSSIGLMGKVNKLLKKITKKLYIFVGSTDSLSFMRNITYAEVIINLFIKQDKATIELLPCLPKLFSRGNIKGLQFRNYKFSFCWDNSKIRELFVYSNTENSIELKYNAHFGNEEEYSHVYDIKKGEYTKIL